jgi:hypothetical protein
VNFGKSAICNASCPDDARTGYPGAYQWYDEKQKLWRWLFVGSSTCDVGTAQVERQANSTPDIKIGTRVRFVYIKRWKHPTKRSPYLGLPFLKKSLMRRRVGKGWKAQIKFVVEAKKTANSKGCSK